MNNNSSKKKFNFHRKQQEMCLKRVFLGTSCLKVVIAVAVICIQFKFPFVSAVIQYFFFLDLKCLVFSIISTAIYFRLSSFATITNISYWLFLLFWGSWDKWREIKTVAFVKTMSWAMALAVLADEEQGIRSKMCQPPLSQLLSRLVWGVQDVLLESLHVITSFSCTLEGRKVTSSLNFISGKLPGHV